MLYLFIDCEFTDFKQMDLISLGIVSEDGKHEFYVEITDHIADYRSDFVNQVVIPLLDTAKYGKSYQWAALHLREWLDALPADQITVVVDYVGDWHLFSEMLKVQPSSKKLNAQLLNHSFLHMLHSRGIHTQEGLNRGFAALTNEMSNYFSIDPRQHHALVDAKANRYGWVKGYEAAK